MFIVGMKASSYIPANGETRFPRKFPIANATAKVRTLAMEGFNPSATLNCKAAKPKGWNNQTRTVYRAANTATCERALTVRVLFSSKRSNFSVMVATVFSSLLRDFFRSDGATGGRTHSRANERGKLPHVNLRISRLH